jgi:retinol dehydrogenase 14
MAKRVLVTGATNGIGLEAAKVLAAEGHEVAIVGRDPARTAEAARAIGGDAPVRSFLCDFSSQADIRRAAGEIRAHWDKIDVLVNNAGTVNDRRTETVDGIETTFAVNHLGYFLFTHLLLDRILAAAPGARIVVVASAGHYRATLDLSDLGFAKGGYSIMGAYSRSKLGNVMFARGLAGRLAGRGVTVNALHPGGVATNIWAGAPFWAKPILAVAKLFMDTPETGGRTIVHLATGADVAAITGKYFDRMVEKKPSDLARDDALGERLWTESARLVGVAPDSLHR